MTSLSFFTFPSFPMTGENIDEDREWDCLYEYFLGYDQYDNFSGYGEDWSEYETIDSMKSWFKEEQERFSMSISWVLEYDNYNVLSSHAREKVLKEIDSKVVAKRFIELYKDVLES